MRNRGKRETMKPKDLEEFTGLLGIMQEAFIPDKPVSKERAKIYFDFLQDLPLEKIKLAVKHIIRTKRISTLPTIGEIRGFIVKDIEELALEAWYKTIRAVEEVGIYVSVEFEDRVIHSVIDNEFSGWERFCNLRREDEPWDRKRFLQSYYLFHEKKDHPKYLPGIHEKENTLKGFNEKKIVFIEEGKEIKKLEGGK